MQDINEKFLCDQRALSMRDKANVGESLRHRIDALTFSKAAQKSPQFGQLCLS